MFKRPFQSVAVAACALPLLALAPSASADSLVSTGEDDYGQTFVQVNGTPGSDLILMSSTLDGGILVVRIGGGIAIGTIAPSLVLTQNIVVLAGDGNDVVDASAVAEGASIEFHGGNGNDTITGSQGSDTIFGEDGNDTLDGGPGYGYDIIMGGAGFADRLYAGAGGASIFDDDGVALALGGDADDSISIFYSADWRSESGDRNAGAAIVCGGGNDLVFLYVDGDPMQFALDGDGNGTLNPGDADEIDLGGMTGLNSTYANFESVNY